MMGSSTLALPGRPWPVGRRIFLSAIGAIAQCIEAKVSEVGGADATTLVVSRDYDLG